MLAGHVGGERANTDKTCTAGNVDNGAANFAQLMASLQRLLVLHDAQLLANTEEYTTVVDALYAVPLIALVAGRRLQRTQNTGAVDGVVEASKGLSGTLDHGHHVGLRADITNNVEDLELRVVRLQLLLEGGELLRLNVGNGDATNAGRDERTDGGLADLMSAKTGVPNCQEGCTHTRSTAGNESNAAESLGHRANIPG